MEPARVLIDTSIIIEHLRKRDRRKSILYRMSNNYALHTSHETLRPHRSPAIALYLLCAAISVNAARDAATRSSGRAPTVTPP